MKILIILIQYHPTITPNVIRWSALAEQWSVSGHEVHILCSARQGLPVKENIRGVHVHRVGQGSLYDWLLDLMGKKARRSDPGAKPVPTKSFTSYVLDGLQKILDLTWRKIYWPDGSCIWYLPARRYALSLIRQQAIDSVISVGLPYTPHLVAYFCKKKLPALHWLMDIEDPFSISREIFVNNHFLYGAFNFRQEGRAMGLADRISFTNTHALSIHQVLFPASASKMSVVSPLYIPFEREEDTSVPYFKDSSKCHFAYFGSFYHQVRTPMGLLSLLNKTLEIKPELASTWIFHFFGKIELEFQKMFDGFREIKKICVFHGMVSPRQARAAMKQVDFLIHLGNSTRYHLPSKAPEYLNSCKPVIHIGAIEKDSFCVFAKGYPLLLDIVVDAANIEEQQVIDWIQFIHEKRGMTADSSLVAKMLAPYTLETIGEAYTRLLRPGK